MKPIRFKDENRLLSNFFDEVLVVCPSCAKQATALTNPETKTARLFCLNCGYNKETTTMQGPTITMQLPANQFFYAELWLQAPFKKEEFFAYNYDHLDYLERYISAALREHNDRTHFTLLEKLPKFYHEAKNRTGLLKIITNLKNKK